MIIHSVYENLCFSYYRSIRHRYLFRVLFITQLRYKDMSTTLKYVLLRSVKKFLVNFGDPVEPWLLIVLAIGVCITPQSLGKTWDYQLTACSDS